jgi:hypothetical protein
VFPEYQELKIIEAQEDPAPLEVEGEAPLDQSPKELAEVSELDKIVRQIRLVLGGDSTTEIAKAELQAIAELPTNQEHKLPKTIKSALGGSNSASWREAAKYEIKKFKSLGVWEPVHLYKGVKVLGVCIGCLPSNVCSMGKSTSSVHVTLQRGSTRLWALTATRLTHQLLP